jgi:hypothetical protein
LRASDNKKAKVILEDKSLEDSSEKRLKRLGNLIEKLTFGSDVCVDKDMSVGAFSDETAEGCLFFFDTIQSQNV